jgi:WD40 repeat protein
MTDSVIQSDTSTQQFQWDGWQFTTFNLEGPQEAFAFSSSDGLWVWANGNARKIDDNGVNYLAWSEGGTQLAYAVWWPSNVKGIRLYNTASGEESELTPVEGAIYALEWAPIGNFLGYVQASPATIHLRDLSTGSTSVIEANAQGFSWAPAGDQFVYDDRGSLFRYSLASEGGQMLVVADENAGEESPGVYRPSWSPRGDLVACILSQDGTERPVLIDALSNDQIPAADLLNRALDIAALRVDVHWSPSGEQLAVVTSNPASGSRKGTIYLIDVSSVSSDAQELFQSQDAESISTPVWDSSGERLAAVIERTVMVWDVTAGTSETWYTFPTSVESDEIAWAPDGSGLVVSHGQQLYWLASSATDKPVLLLQDTTIESVRFALP